ncbi:hypothetical protein ACQKDD_01540 [Planococcus kocurii]|uniref:hypothetical protein n=1 Tax=Planococcus kocurii TaxID=1374 RepID=UPI003CFCC77A
MALSKDKIDNSIASFVTSGLSAYAIDRYVAADLAGCPDDISARAFCAQQE